MTYADVLESANRLNLTRCGLIQQFFTFHDIHMVLEGANTHHLAHGGLFRHLWSAATRPTPFLSGVVIVSTLQLAMPRSGVHRFTFHTVHIVFQGA